MTTDIDEAASPLSPRKGKTGGSSGRRAELDGELTPASVDHGPCNPTNIDIVRELGLKSVVVRPVLSRASFM
jgi:hypothetical protein